MPSGPSPVLELFRMDLSNIYRLVSLVGLPTSIKDWMNCTLWGEAWVTALNWSSCVGCSQAAGWWRVDNGLSTLIAGMSKRYWTGLGGVSCGACEHRWAYGWVFVDECRNWTVEWSAWHLGHPYWRPEGCCSDTEQGVRRCWLRRAVRKTSCCHGREYGKYSRARVCEMLENMSEVPAPLQRPKKTVSGERALVRLVDPELGGLLLVMNMAVMDREGTGSATISTA